MIQNFISKLSEKEHKIFYLAVAFMVLAIFDRLFLGPVMARLRTIDDEIRREEDAIKSDLRILSYRERILKENESLEKYYTVDVWTEEEIIADFFKKIEIVATKSGVNLIKVSPSEVRNRTGFIEYHAQLEASGKLTDVVGFMYSIDSADDLMRTASLNLEPRRGATDEVNASITVVRAIIDLRSVEEARRVAVAGGVVVDGRGAQSVATQRDASRPRRGAGDLTGQPGASSAGPATSDREDGVTSDSGRAASTPTGTGSGVSSGPGAGSAPELSADREGRGGVSGGGLMGADASDEQEDQEGEIAEGAQPSQPLSQRFRMTGGGEAKQAAPVDSADAEEIKPSLFERIMQRVQEK